MSLNVQARVSGAAEAVIAAGEKAELKKVGKTVAFGTGLVLVPTGAVVGAAGGAVAQGITGYADAYRREPKLKSSFMNVDKTAYVAGVTGGVGLAIGVGALALGADVTALQALGAGIGGAGLGFVGSGIVNGVWGALNGAVKGGDKGIDVGIGTAKVIGGGAQIASDATIKLAKELCGDIAHVVQVGAHNVAEAGREGYENLSRFEANVLQGAADLAKAKANAVSNGPAYDKNGKELPNKPGEYEKLD